MPQSAYIKFSREITLDEVKHCFQYYQEMASLTGKQLGWDYQKAAFPYEIHEKEQDSIPYLWLKSKEPHLYNYLVVGVGQEKNGTYYIQIVLPDRGTHGDMAKGNEYARFLAKQLKGELHLFNGRVQDFQTQK